MKYAFALAAVAAGSVVSIAQAQTVTPNPEGYQFEFRIIADGTAGAPSGPGTVYPFATGATRIGFWIQARVSQTINENWGITRVSPPAAPETSAITVTDPAGASTLARGSTNAANTNFGRGSGYRNGGPGNNSAANTATGNDVGAVAFPGIANNQNGTIDSGGTRIFSFDSYVGSTRNPANPDEPSNPWNVNGASGSGSPVALGQFSPWASVYRFTLDITDWSTARVVNVNAFALINGAISVHPTDASQTQFAMEVGPGRSMSANFSITIIPTPGAAALLGVGALMAGRRRR